MNGLATRRALREARHTTDCGCMGCAMARAAAADYAADLDRSRAALFAQNDEQTQRMLAAAAQRIDAEDLMRGQADDLDDPLGLWRALAVCAAVMAPLIAVVAWVLS